LATGSVDLHLVIVLLRKNFIHAHVEYAQWLYDSVRRLEDTVVGEDMGKNESDKNAKKLLPSIAGKSFYWD